MKPSMKILIFAYLVFGTLLFVMLLSRPARAAGSWYVASTGSDSDTCTSVGDPCATINGAIGKATAGDMIFVATGVYTRNTGSEVVLIEKNITLSGGWDAAFATQNGLSTIDGSATRRGIRILHGVVAVIVNFIVQNGFDGAQGAGVLNSGVLTVSGTTIKNNMTTGDGGGIFNAWSGWPQSPDGTLTLNNTIIENNMANRGGGIFNLQGSYEAGGSVVLNHSVVRDNQAASGGGVYSQESYGEFGLVLNNSTVSNNIASVYNGGGINVSGKLILNNSTISGNEAKGDGGGIYGSQYALTLSNSTVSANIAGNNGGGIASNNGPAALKNSIIAGNATGTTGPDCIGAISSAGYNLVGSTSGCTFTPGTGDLTNVFANLGQLIGSSGYHPLLSGSPAINAGNPAGCDDHLGNPLNTDQRGAARVGICDIGAYEYTIPGPADRIAVLGGTHQHAPPLKAFSLPLTVTVFDSIGSPVSNAEVTFSAPKSGASGSFADSGTFTTTAVTDASGITSAATFTANSAQGPYLVQATVNNLIPPASFMLSNILWYVATNGSNGDDCQAPAKPCATINGVLAKDGFFAGDTVLVASGVYTSSMVNEVVLLDKNTTLSGGWDAKFTTQNGKSTIDGEGERRGIRIINGVTVSLEYLSIQNGFADGRGIGIFNFDGNVTLNNLVIIGNKDVGDSVGIHNIGVITVNNSTISGHHGHGIDNGGTLTLNNSTVSGNGMGIYNAKTLFLNNSTVSYNTVGIGMLNNNTVTLKNSILASNTWDCAGALNSSGFNLIENATNCTVNAATGDLLNVAPKLFPLTGWPGYHPLLVGSPAIDSGDPAGCKDHLGNSLNSDQRGVVRVGRCDIGAYEFDPNNNPISQIFLPAIYRPWACFIGICGRVTLNGTPAAGVMLELRFFDGASWITKVSTITGSGGEYSFQDVPGLAAGQKYYVRYRNYANTPGLIWVWGTRELTSYQPGSTVAIGNFDIADITLVSPADGAMVALAYTFQWVPRPATPSDSYEFNLYNPYTGDPYFYTAPPLGYVGSYNLNSLPSGFFVENLYVWEIWVYSPDGGYGISYETRAVHFSNTGLSAIAPMTPAPLKSVPYLDQRRRR